MLVRGELSPQDDFLTWDRLDLMTSTVETKSIAKVVTGMLPGQDAVEHLRWLEERRKMGELSTQEAAIYKGMLIVGRLKHDPSTSFADLLPVITDRGLFTPKRSAEIVANCARFDIIALDRLFEPEISAVMRREEELYRRCVLDALERHGVSTFEEKRAYIHDHLTAEDVKSIFPHMT